MGTRLGHLGALAYPVALPNSAKRNRWLPNYPYINSSPYCGIALAGRIPIQQHG